MKTKVLITGATGLVGGRLNQFLLKRGISTTKTSRSKKNFSKINWYSKKNLESLCKGKDIVINCAGTDANNSNNLKKTKKTNSDFPFKLFNAANKNKVKLFIFLSTYHVYDFKKYKIINEKSKTKAKNNYTESKILGEKKLLNYKSNYTKILIIRSCNLFGYPIYKTKNCWKLIINSMVKKIGLNKKFIVKSKTNEYRYYSSVKSFCYFVFFLIKNYKKINFKKNKKILNFSSNFNLNITDLSKIITNKLKKSESLVKFKFKNLNKAKKNLFKSLYQKGIYNNQDRFFFEEIKILALNVKKLNR